MKQTSSYPRNAYTAADEPLSKVLSTICLQDRAPAVSQDGVICTRRTGILHAILLV
jgi:hypothetical protein